MEVFLTLILSLFFFFYLYIHSFKLNDYFTQAKEKTFFIMCFSVFTLLFLSVILVFIDIMTTSTNKDFLAFKENFAIFYMFFLELVLMLVFPSIYMVYIIKDIHENQVDSQNWEDIVKLNQLRNLKTAKIRKYMTLYSIYLLVIVSLNLVCIKTFPFYYNVYSNNTGFSDKVPEGLALYGKIDPVFYQIVYFNFGLLMMVGKFLGFTYMPYGMAKYVHDLIYPEVKYIDEKSHVFNNFEKITHNEIKLEEKKNNLENENSNYIYVDSTKSKSEGSNQSKNKSNIFSKENSNSEKSHSKDSLEIEEKNNSSNQSMFTHKSDIDEENENLIKNKIITVEEYFHKLKIKEQSEKLNFQYEKTKTYTGKKNIRLNLFTSLSKNIFSICIILYIILSILLVFGIIYTKITILYTKLMYNICGVDCGLLAYRFDDVFSLETFTSMLSTLSQNMNIYIKFDFLFFSFLLLFRTLTIYKSFSLKGISFMWKIFYKPDPKMPRYHIVQIYATIFFTGLVLLYDFTYLFPDYIRFNGLDPVCDYTLINKSYCGVSFYGLLFIKISMNFHFFMYWDIVASAVFITNGIIWAFRLIIHPLIKSFFGCEEDGVTKENEKLKII